MTNTIEVARIEGMVAVHEAEVRERMNADDNATMRYVANATHKIAIARTVCEAIRAHVCRQIAEIGQAQALMEQLQQTRDVLLALARRDDLPSEERKLIVPQLQRLHKVEHELGLTIARTVARRHGDFSVDFQED